MLDFIDGKADDALRELKAQRPVDDFFCDEKKRCRINKDELQRNTIRSILIHRCTVYRVNHGGFLNNKSQIHSGFVLLGQNFAKKTWKSRKLSFLECSGAVGLWHYCNNCNVGTADEFNMNMLIRYVDFSRFFFFCARSQNLPHRILSE